MDVSYFNFTESSNTSQYYCNIGANAYGTGGSFTIMKAGSSLVGNNFDINTEYRIRIAGMYITPQ